MSHIVYLSLGSNLGNRTANLRAAIAAMPPTINVLGESPTYETPPWGYTEQPAFLNLALKGETDLTPLELLVFLKSVETQVGRVASFRYGPRQIDLDILFYNSLVLETPRLFIPHPRLHERAFVLVPLADLAPDLRHPVFGKTISELLAKVNRSGISRWVGQG